MSLVCKVCTAGVHGRLACILGVSSIQNGDRWGPGNQARSGQSGQVSKANQIRLMVHDM